MIMDVALYQIIIIFIIIIIRSGLVTIKYGQRSDWDDVNSTKPGTKKQDL